MASRDELNWDDLRYLLRAAQAGTLSGAARALNVEHTTIGRRLSSLERSLGLPLIHRGPDGVTVNSVGAKVTPLIEEIERTVTAIRRITAVERTHVRLATPTGFTKLFSESLPQFRTQHPNIELDIISGARPVDLSKGEADLSVRGGPVREPDLMIRRLGDSGFSLYASRGYLSRKGAPDPDDLAGHDIIGLDPSLAAAAPAQWIERHAGKAVIVLRSREMMDVLSAALSGVGLALLPCLLGDDEPRLTRLTPRVLVAIPLSLVFRREVQHAPSVRLVSRFVVNVMRQHAAQVYGAD